MTTTEAALRDALEYRKTATIKAVQWWKMGDHPAVILKSDRHRYADEGIPWIETLEGGHVVTPGDWIATGIKGEHWPIKPDVFAATYEPVSQPSPASSTVGEGDDYKRGIYAAKCWLRDQQHKNPPDSLWHAAAILADRMDVALLSSSGEPASVAAEAEARLLDIAAERAAQIRSSCYDYCTGDCNCVQAAEDAVSEMERLIAALSKPTPVEAEKETMIRIADGSVHPLFIPEATQAPVEAGLREALLDHAKRMAERIAQWHPINDSLSIPGAEARAFLAALSET